MIKTILKIIEEKSNIQLPILYEYNENIIDNLLFHIKLKGISDEDITNRFINDNNITTCKDRMMFNHSVFMEIYNLTIITKLSEYHVNDEMIKSIIKRYKEEHVLELNNEIFIKLFKGQMFNNAFFYEYDNINNLYKYPVTTYKERFFSEQQVNIYLNKLDSLIEEYMKSI